MTQVRLEDRYTADSGPVQMTGVQALARLPLNILRSDRARGRKTAVFISGYEGSPLGGYDLELGRHAGLLASYDLVFQPGVNEELAATSVQGTQLAAGMTDARVEGVTGFWYGKSPGLDRASDALRHANLMGTHPHGGAVAFVGDDPAAKSSTVPGASEFLLADLGMPVLYPADPQDVLDLGTHAVAMSRLSGLWVALKIATNVADSSGTVEIDSDALDPQLPLVMFEGKKWEHHPNARMLQPALSEMERTREGVRLDAARAYALANRLNRIQTFGPGHGEAGGASVGRAGVGIVAAGKTYLDTRQALRTLGLDEAELAARGVRLLRLAMIHPLIALEIEEFADGLAEIIVVEEKRPFIESAVKEILYGVRSAPAVTGKTDPAGAKLFAAHGELDADLIAAGLAARLGTRPEFTTVTAWQARQALRRTVTQLPLVARTPYFCSGCPHNSSTKVPEGSLVGGGIGCHALVLMMEPEAVGDVVGLTQMGGEGAQWIGMAPFMRTRRHLLQNIGDGTFHHSGSLAVRAAIASGVNVTYKLLYNSAVAMTGGQQATGAMSIPALTKMLAAEGVRRIVITTAEPGHYRRAGLAPITEVWHRDRVVEAQEVLSQVEGVTVLIHDQECATELCRKRKRGLAADPAERVMINQRVCEGCGDCGEKSNCLSVQPVDTDFGRKTVIDQSSCNKDYSCLKGDCPSFLTVVPRDPGTLGSSPRPRRTTAPALAPDAIADPRFRFDVATAPHTTRITGVGGTGVVTLSQVLSAAGRIAGRQVRSLDQTGLAQKGGAVISDIKISAGEIEQSNKAVAGECDLYLGCDLLVAADAKNLAVADPSTTIAVVSTTKVPTGRMVVDKTVPFPDVDATADRIRSATRGAESVFVDARGLSVTLFGSDQFANMLLAGVAFQTGALPLPARSIEQAIELNGVQVEPNLQAFRRGRQRVADPAAFAQAAAALSAAAPVRVPAGSERALIDSVGAEPGSELHRIVTARIPDLVEYQNADYARRYADLVARVRAAELRSVPEKTELSQAVAEFGYKLMAYKDEYEVARLLVDPQAEAAVRAEFGAGARVSYQLHPPVLRALGMKRKLKLGPWSRPGFRLLRAGKIVRGTRLDPFGYTQVRRVERQLISEYTATIDDLLRPLSAGTYPRAVEIARLPDLVRGYENIKLANVALYRARVRELLSEPTAVSS
ncbi:MAG TPA: indolepyruvate ferredoxin oxidoreductase family protein [Streptosporangiaceae bacterium]|nr:indolepyruvate ferredoxin oxidoreductase family protein [Streptosporangiaceae bacterium]